MLEVSENKKDDNNGQEMYNTNSVSKNYSNNEKSSIQNIDKVLKMRCLTRNYAKFKARNKFKINMSKHLIYP